MDEQKTFSIPVTWEVWDKVEVKADTLEDAIRQVKNNIDDIPLGTQPEYIDSSFRIDDGNSGQSSVEDTAEYIKTCWDFNNIK